MCKVCVFYFLFSSPCSDSIPWKYTAHVNITVMCGLAATLGTLNLGTEQQISIAYCLSAKHMENKSNSSQLTHTQRQADNNPTKHEAATLLIFSAVADIHEKEGEQQIARVLSAVHVQTSFRAVMVCKIVNNLYDCVTQ